MHTQVTTLLLYKSCLLNEIENKKNQLKAEIAALRSINNEKFNGQINNVCFSSCVVTAIGGLCSKCREFNTRLSAIEGSNVDVSGISKNAEHIAVINEKVDGLDLSQIAV